MPLNDSDRLKAESEHAPLHSTPQNQVPIDQAPDVPPSADPVGTRIFFVAVAMVVLMFLISLGFLFLVARPS